MLKRINKILKEYIDQHKKYDLEVFNFDLNENKINYAVDAGIKSFTHPFLKNIEGYVINVVVSKNEKIIKSAQIILFCSNSKLKEETLKENIKQYRFLINFCKELGYSLEEIIENFFNPNTKTDDFLSKVRDFAEIAMLYEILKKKNDLVLRDGLFYFPYNFPGERDIENIFLKYKRKFVSISKSSKILKDYYFIKNLFEYINSNKRFFVKVDVDKYYTKKQISFLSDFIVRFSNVFGSREFYHVQTSDERLIEDINIQKNFNYPLALYVADKYSRLNEKEIKNLELKILKENYEELKEIYFNTYKYQRETWKKLYDN